MIDTDSPNGTSLEFSARERRLSTKQFTALRDRLYRETGITLNDTKLDLVESRLARRLRKLNLASYDEYLELLDEPGSKELQEFINALTTNKTDFFRESHHFEELKSKFLPQLKQRRGVGPLRIWCAASSTGEEPYSIAMTVHEFCANQPGWDIQIVATDIDTEVLQSARRGIYAEDRIRGIAPDRLKKYFLRGDGEYRGYVSVKPELKRLIDFRQLNLISDRWDIQGPFDIIFCRNVIIYFDRPTQMKLFDRFSKLLTPESWLILGHSENLHWLTERYRAIGGTIYQIRTDGSQRPATTTRTSPAPAAASSRTAMQQDRTIVLGEVHADRGPGMIRTLLGSCVAACIWDPVAKVGGMNHFSLPGSGNMGADARYGAYAMELLITAIMKLGGDRSRFQAKVFGGGKVLKMQSESLNVGAKNAAFVKEFLSMEGIPIVKECLGGEQGMIVRFRPDTGQAFMKPLDMDQSKKLVSDESDYTNRIRERTIKPADDGITLF